MSDLTALIGDFPYQRALLARRPHFRVQRPWLFISLIVAIVGMSYLSEQIAPNAGIWTRIQYGNRIANLNFQGEHVLYSRNVAVLQFEVASQVYVVRTPIGPLTPDEREALFAYARFMHYPAYAADGPLSVDP